MIPDRSRSVSTVIAGLDPAIHLTKKMDVRVTSAFKRA
jgi:hypothetical protein